VKLSMEMNASGKRKFAKEQIVETLGAEVIVSATSNGGSTRSKSKPVPANIGEARMASCGCARVIPREVASKEVDPVSTEV
jgi:hypothetical protein